MTPVLDCRGLVVEYSGVVALEDVDLAVRDGETVALLGPSGSGKSTLLHAVAGFLDVAAGSIEIDGQTVSTTSITVAPDRRPVGMVFQNYALWPHLSARETVAYPLRRSGLSKGIALERAQGLLELVGIGELSHRRPAEMSGGQQQRVGLARALARNARLYLFDEPTAHLDATVRVVIQEEIARRRVELGAAALYATHDASEALAVADRVAVLRQGQIVQLAPPSVVYERPVDVWAARLTGPASVYDVTIHGATALLGPGKVPVEIDPQAKSDGPGRMIVRPEWVDPDGWLEGVVREVWYRGPHTDYRIATAYGDLTARLPGPPSVPVGARHSWGLRRGWVPGS